MRGFPVDKYTSERRCRRSIGAAEEKIAGLRQQMEALKAVKDAPEQQVSLTNDVARPMATSGTLTVTVGYNANRRRRHDVPARKLLLYRPWVEGEPWRPRKKEVHLC